MSPQGGAAYFIMPDHLGAPHEIVNAANARVWFWDHDPFGNGTPTATAGFSHDLRFPGQIYDSETRLHNNGFRDYSPSLGRYVQSDPIGLAGGINTYAYAGNNPVSRIDPLGLDPDSKEKPEALPDIDVAGQRKAAGTQVAQNFAFHDINPVIIDAGIKGIALPPTTFQSIVGKHGPNTNRTFPTSKFHPQFVSDRDSFVRLIMQPALGGPSTPSITPFSRVPGQLDITTDLGVTIGTNLDGQPTSMVTVRIAPAFPVFGFLGLYNVTGAFPK